MTTEAQSILLGNDEENRWSLLKVRWISLIAFLAYPFWGYVYNTFAPEAYDPMWLRLIFMSLAGASFLLSFKVNFKRNYLDHLYHFVFFALTGHCFFMIYINDVSPLYVLGGYCMVFSGGAAVLTARVLLYYFIYAIAYCGAIAIYHQTTNSYFLFFGAVTALIISYSGLKCILYLADRLRESRNKVQDQNRTLDCMINSLGQGFFTFNRDGVCQPIFSQACTTLLEKPPGGLHISKVIGIETGQLESFNYWVSLCFKDKGSFARFANLGPKSYAHSKGKHIVLEYQPILDANGEVSEVVVIATDKTEEINAEKAAEVQRDYAGMVTSIVKNKTLFRAFLSDFFSRIEIYKNMSWNNSEMSYVDVDFKRFLHTVKGAAAVFGMTEFSSTAGKMESKWVDILKRGSDIVDTNTAELIKEQVHSLESMMNDFTDRHAEIVGSEFAAGRIVEMPLAALESFVRSSDFQRLSAGIKKPLLDSMKVPVQSCFAAYSVLSTNLAKTLQKSLKSVEFKNGELLVYPEAYNELFAAFVHAFRNAVDHGLETPDERVATGKDPTGKIDVEFKKTTETGRDWLTISVCDDGRGIDPSRLRQKLKSLGRDKEAQSLSDAEVLQLIFEPGFSTKEKVNDISGRGVGLDALKACAVSLGGSVKITSEMGKGTLIEVRVPDLSPDSQIWLTKENEIAS